MFAGGYLKETQQNRTAPVHNRDSRCAAARGETHSVSRQLRPSHPLSSGPHSSGGSLWMWPVLAPSDSSKDKEENGEDDGEAPQNCDMAQTRFHGLFPSPGSNTCPSQGCLLCQGTNS